MRPLWSGPGGSGASRNNHNNNNNVTGERTLQWFTDVGGGGVKSSTTTSASSERNQKSAICARVRSETTVHTAYKMRRFAPGPAARGHHFICVTAFSSRSLHIYVLKLVHQKHTHVRSRTLSAHAIATQPDRTTTAKTAATTAMAMARWWLLTLDDDRGWWWCTVARPSAFTL